MVQEVPPYSSVTPVTFASDAPSLPPNANPKVCPPEAAKPLRAVAKTPPTVQVEPSYSLVVVTDG